MEQLAINKELLDFFKSDPETLLFDGFACYDDNAVAYREGNSLALVAKVRDTYKLCLKTDSEQFVLNILSSLHGKIEFCGVDTFVTEWIRPRYPFAWETNCYLYAWNGKPLQYVCKEKLYPMSAKYAQMISDGTHYGAPLEEIKESLKMYPSVAVFLDGKPVSWCLCHNDKSLGMLYTVPEHRRKGYALEVMTALCNKVIAEGNVPYAYIVRTNTPSLNLAPKYNLKRVKEADYFLITK